MMEPKKKKTFAKKARAALSKYLPTKKPTKEYTMPVEKEGGRFAGTTDVTISRMNRRRKILEESLKY